MQRRSLLLGATGALAMSRTARADDYPSRPVTMIVPYGPGGGVSINARALQPYYEKTLGTRVIVENREGAGGITGYTVGAFAKPDGYTITMVSPAITASPWLVPNVRFTPEDYAFIGQVSFVPNMLVVNADSPFQTLKDLVDAMKAEPGEISTGSRQAGQVPASAEPCSWPCPAARRKSCPASRAAPRKSPRCWAVISISR
jgi:tripartite-type tricarboxylate transporter receptor subunit TctC